MYTRRVYTFCSLCQSQLVQKKLTIQLNFFIFFNKYSALKKLYSDSKKNLDSISKKFHEVSEKLIQKSRQYQKLQSNYESLRRRSVSASVFEAGDSGKDVPKNFTIPLSSGDGFLQKESSRSSSRSSSPVQRKFVMFPRATPDHAIQNKFTLPLGTPTK
ncbi:CCNB1IP1 [Mytilus edulis]|uniref:CCNB1IP1 n=1 Tax=Mytilus edulis TaxID=6550 RepID=A0A8S3UGQ9_MYTED|nr:CCNB1IP1 [Mytilus edulis]